MPHTRLRPTYTFDQDRLDQLRAVAPEAFADGKIDWDTLRDLLGDTVQDPAVEHFGLSWPGKRDARRLASRPSRAQHLHRGREPGGVEAATQELRRPRQDDLHRPAVQHGE